jgi:ABC-type antimicrobial peptide transport system permease subunit
MASSTIQRQISLPISKAVEIAWKSIRLRLSRSLVVTASIALAIAFLLSILAGEAIVDSMRDWKSGFETSTRYTQLLAERSRLEEQLHGIEAGLRAGLRGATGQPKPLDFKRQFGGELAQIRQELGGLPAPASELAAALPKSSQVQGEFSNWLNTSRKLKGVRDELASPQVLEARLKAAGAATSESDIHSARVQTRWVIGLALLVAFVGILNAMLMSVTERFREIGTMKCLGALDGFIVKLFLLESLFQGVAGTVIGLILGLALSVASAGYSYGGFAWVNFPAGQLLLATGACLLVGVILTVAGALYPAWQAARMQPIAAMRVDV